jgi:hypothetical protein
MNRYIPFIILIAFTNLQAQNQTEMALYNIGLGSVFGGVGAVINKNPDDKLGETFLNGFWKGAIGGYLIYESKNIVSKIPQQEQWEYSWAAKLVNSAGTSIVENAAYNRGLTEQWHLNIGFNRIEFYTKDQFKVKYKVMPVSLILTTIIATKTKFEFSRSLQTGEFIFSDKYLSSNELKAAYVYGNVMIIDNSFFNDYFIFAHELIHIYQYYDYNFANAFAQKPLDTFFKNSKTYRTINSIFHFDIAGAITLRGLYLQQDKNRDCYFDNFFEYEADFYGRGRRTRCP